MTRALVACLLAVALAAVASAQQPTSTRDAQKRLEQVRRELNQVATERRRLEGQRGAASRELRAVEERVAASSRALQEAEQALRREQDALVQLEARRAELLRQQAGTRAELARLVRAAHAQGDAAPLKLLLAQDRVADGQRALVYFGYLQRERVKRTEALAAELAELDRVEAQIRSRRTALDEARAQRRAQLAALARDREARTETLSTLEQRYRDRAARERALGTDAKALQQVVNRLRATAARDAAQRAEAEKRAAAAERRNRANAPAGGATRATTPPKPPRQVASAPAVRVGGLGWPLSGSLLAGYGGRMPDGRASTGLLIGAPAGTAVRAVADGTVVFAEWMTGYGMILIIDHGNGYLSLYAHNEALLRDVGAQVKRGDAVARVGNSGGLAQPALYFELRRNGQAVNPGGWLGRQ